MNPNSLSPGPMEESGMSIATEIPASLAESKAEKRPELPDARVLEDRTPLWMRSSPGSAMFTGLLGFVFVLLASTPLWHTDLWDHLNYGNEILASRRVSHTEPLMTLCRGVRMINIPWLAQVSMASLNERFGLTSLQFLTAILVTSSLAVIVWRTVSTSRSNIAGLIAGGIFLKTNLHEFLVIRPQLAGLLFYCIVFAWMTGRRRFGPTTWILMPLMFLLWANIHGSFAMGLFLLAASVAGRFGDILVISRSVRTAIRDRALLKGLLLLQLCAAAVVCNPSGLSVYPEVLSVAGNPNVASMFEWEPLTLRQPHGQTAAAVFLLAVMAIRLSPRRLKCGEVMVFIITGLLSAWSARMLNWWAPVAACLVGTHLLAGIRKTSPFLKGLTVSKRSGLWTVVNLGLIWIALQLTPFWIQVYKGRVPNAQRLVSRETPLAVTAHLSSAENLPDGVAFVPAEWAGYVMNRGPASIRPMVNLHVHVIPERVWADYLRLINGPSDWQGLMDEYGINLAVVGKVSQSSLVRRMKESADWTVAFEDAQGVVFTRRQPI